ncbi:MAG: hypothetical protein U0324_32100 [Polyangiales bacterium]
MKGERIGASAIDVPRSRSKRCASPIETGVELTPPNPQAKASGVNATASLLRPKPYPGRKVHGLVLVEEGAEGEVRHGEDVE